MNIRINRGWMMAAAAGLSLGLMALTGGPATAQQQNGGAQKAEAPAAQPDLKPIWTKGQVSRYEISTSKSTVRQAAGQQESMKTGYASKMKVTWKVEDADPAGGGRCSLLIEDFSVELTSPKGEKFQVNRDSNDERFEGLVAVLKAFSGSTLTVTVSGAGDALKVDGFEAIKSKAGEAGEQFTEADFKEMATDLAIVARGEAKPAAGAKWDRKFTWNHELGNLHYQSKYTLVGVEEIEGVSVAVIGRESTITHSPDPAKQPMQEDGPKVTIKLLQGSEKSQIMFDATRNENVGLNTDLTLAFELTLNLGDRNFVQQINEKIQTRVLRIEEK